MSQPNEITLPVDEENDGVGLVNHVYTNWDRPANRSVYIGPGHTTAQRNLLGLYRALPKPSGNFRGVSKISFKFTRDIVVLGVDGSNIISPTILEVSSSLPVGATAAQTLLLRQLGAACLCLGPIAIPLFDQQMV